jgi:hypothetical protein
VFCGCFEPVPSYITVRINGITNGTDCDQCEQLNRDYSLELTSSHPWYCDWVCDLEDFAPGVAIYVEARIGWSGPTEDYYFIEVALITTIDDCTTGHQHTYWYHRQSTPYDCSNLNVLVPLKVNEMPEVCTGGSCRIIS